MIYRKCFEVVGYFVTKFYSSCNSASPVHLYRLTAIQYWKRNPSPKVPHSTLDSTMELLFPTDTSSTDYFQACSMFTQLQKATIRFIMSVCISVCLSIHMEQLGSYWMDFH